MLPHVSLRALGAALCLLSLTSAHMQMLDPSPFRDPHSKRNEPKDYNILTPLHADGSDFACKGYQWNTPWTTVATYEAGKSYNMTLKGSATHGGGSCQLSLSCDGGIKFKVIKSIMGGCPLQSSYPFTIPEEFARTSKATCLFAWTWFVANLEAMPNELTEQCRFNKIGNREMYMNCAVVDIVPKKLRGRSSAPRSAPVLDARAIARANAAAQTALAGYPDLFVANLRKVNGCVVKETMDVVFDDPGRSVSFGNGVKGTSTPSFKRGVCTGSGMESAGSSASSSMSSNGGWKESSSSNGKDWSWQGGDPSSQSPSQSQGDDGQWHGGSKSSSGDDGQWHGGGKSSAGDDGQWHGGGQTSQSSSGDDGQWHNGQTKLKNQQEQNPSTLRPVDISQGGQLPNANVQSQLDAYLAKLYGKGTSNGKRYAQVQDEDDTKNDKQETLAYENTRAREEHANHDSEEPHGGPEGDSLYRSIYSRLPRSSRHKRWSSYKQSRAALSTIDGKAKSNTGQAATTAAGPAPSNRDSSFQAILTKLNSLGDTLFTLFKFAETHLDSPVPGKYIFGANSTNNNQKIANKPKEKRDTAAGSVATERITWSTILADLNRIQSKVSDLIQFVENKVWTSGEDGQRVKRSSAPRVLKRQLVIPGIIPATVQNGEPFYFPEGDGQHGGDPTKAKPRTRSESSNQAPVETGVSSKLQGEGTPELGAVEALFPGLSSDTTNDRPQEPKATQSYDWARIYPDTEKSVHAEVTTAVMSPTPVVKWKPAKEHGSDGGRVPPVVGPTPFSDWDKVEATSKDASGREPPSVQSDNGAKWVGEEIYPKPAQPTKLPLPPSNATNATYTPSNATKTTQALGEALKHAFPKLAHPTTNQPIGQPLPLPSDGSNTDKWRDGVFPGLERGHKASSTTPTPAPTALNKENAAAEKAIAALLPYLLAPGPVLPSTLPLPSPQPGPHPTNSQTAPDNLETMPRIINDLGPEDEASIRKFFDDLAKQAAAQATPSAAAAHAA